MSEEPAEAGGEACVAINFAAMTDEEFLAMFAFTEDERAAGRAAARNPARWHRKTGEDWWAARLQIARGVKRDDIADTLRMSTRRMRDRAEDEGWAGLSDADREALSRHVIVSRCERELAANEPHDFMRMRRDADWARIEPHTPAWTPKDPALPAPNQQRSKTMHERFKPDPVPDRATLFREIIEIRDRLERKHRERTAQAGEGHSEGVRDAGDERGAPPADWQRLDIEG